jgi:hypothetical protein
MNGLKLAQLLGQPCNFYARVQVRVHPPVAVHRAVRGSSSPSRIAHPGDYSSLPSKIVHPGDYSVVAGGSYLRAHIIISWSPSVSERKALSCPDASRRRGRCGGASPSPSHSPIRCGAGASFYDSTFSRNVWRLCGGSKGLVMRYRSSMIDRLGSPELRGTDRGAARRNTD